MIKLCIWTGFRGMLLKAGVKCNVMAYFFWSFPTYSYSGLVSKHFFVAQKSDKIAPITFSDSEHSQLRLRIYRSIIFFSKGRKAPRKTETCSPSGSWVHQRNTKAGKDKFAGDALPKWVSTPRKFNSSHLKMDGWNTSFILGRPIFRCELLVSGRVSRMWTHKYDINMLSKISSVYLEFFCFTS